MALFFINLSFANSYIEFNEEELKHFNKYYSFEDFSKIVPRNEMNLKEIFEDSNTNFRRKLFLKKAKKNKEDSVFMSCKENKWLLKDSSEEIFIVLNSMRSKAFLTRAGISNNIYKLSKASPFYYIGTKPDVDGARKFFVMPPYTLDTNTSMLSIYSVSNKTKYARTHLSGERKCTIMDYSKWLSRLLSIKDKLKKKMKKNKKKLKKN